MAPSSSSALWGRKQRGCKGKAPFSGASGGPSHSNKNEPGKSPPDGVSPPLRVGGLFFSALELLIDNWSRFLGAVCLARRISHPLPGLSSSPLLHPDIVSAVPDRVTGLVPGDRENVVQKCL